jgi:hypothetical protein
MKGGGKRLPTHAHRERASHPLALPNIDLFGPTQNAGINGERYILAIYDDYSRRYHAECLRSKSPHTVTRALRDYITLGENQLAISVKR